jgi:uncharacterized protein YdgA (DUF945 family)
MKKGIAAVVVLALLFVCAPWGMGRIAESRLNKALDKAVKEAPYIRIAERKWTHGWFRSEQTVTFEFVLPKLPGAPKPVAAFADAAPADAVPAAPETPTIPQLPKGIPSLPTGPIRFTVHSDVTHGPVLGSAGIGLARLDTKLVISDAIRKKIEEVVGPGEIVQVSTRMGFFGGGTTTFSGKARTVDLARSGKAGAKGTISWDDFSLVVGIGRNAGSYEMQGRQPRIEVNEGEGGSHFIMTNLTVDGTGSRITKDLYDGGAVFGVGKIGATSTRTPAFEMQAIKYGVNSSKKGDFMDYALEMGSGAIKAQPLEAQGFQIKEVHYDMTVRHLHIDTLQKLMEALKEVSAKTFEGAGGSTAQMQAAIMQPLMEHGIELVKHDPELSLDRIGLVTSDGEGVLKGLIKLEGVTDQDLTAGVMAIIPRINADVTVEIAEALANKIPSAAPMIGMGVAQGFLKRENGKLVSHIEFKHSGLTVNGKLPLPGGLPFGRGGAAPSQSAPPAQ